MRKLLRWLGIGLGAVVGLVLLAAGILYFVGSARVNRTFTVRTAALRIPGDSATLARGAHLARTNGCNDCHTPDFRGQVMLDVPPFRAVAANLTRGRGGVGARYTDEDWDRAIRHGVKPDGRPVIVMPSAAFHRMSDEDAAALIAYLRTLPPVDHPLPQTEIHAMGRIVAVFQDLTNEVRTGPARAGHTPPVGPTAEYGAYLASITCAYCHGEDLRGDASPPIPGSPPAPNLAGAGQWPLDGFRRALRTGVTPHGRRLDPEYMPWKITAAMTDVELEALHAHLRTLAAQPVTSR
ncbi:MAG TPA: c-type cytochrome [Longimicrobiaceae bacterium]|nr:c-type cytochrome [Longimicrobiaceae bacterium]